MRALAADVTLVVPTRENIKYLLVLKTKKRTAKVAPSKR